MKKNTFFIASYPCIFVLSYGILELFALIKIYGLFFKLIKFYQDVNDNPFIFLYFN